MAMFINGFWFGPSLVYKGTISAGDVMFVFWACSVATSNLQLCIHCCQQAHNIKVQQTLHFVLFDLWRFGSKCWTIYICYKHSVAATFIIASIRVVIVYLSYFVVLFIIILINH